MIRIKRLIDYKIQDEAKVHGLFFIIDGELYISKDNNVNQMHKDFFATLIKNYSNLNKYKDYSYLYFPRGVVIEDTDSGKIMFNYPPELNENQVQKLIKLFKIETEDIALYDGYHYSFSQLEKAIKNSGWSKSVIDYELGEAKKFFLNQINQFK